MLNCRWCHQLRRGNEKQDSICLNFGECLTAKYHRWYPELVRSQLLEKQCTPEKYSITWDEKGLQFAMSHCMLLKSWVSHLNFAVDERSYMIGVFAGHEFNTYALARKLLRAAVAEQTNGRYFQGIYCYFHAHRTNIDGWYDQQGITRERIIETFSYLCDEILRHTVTKDSNDAPKTGNMPTQIDTNQSFVQLLAASSAMRANFNSDASPLRSLPIIGANGITNGLSSINIISTLASTNASKQSALRSSKSGKSSSRKDNENKMATKIRQECDKIKCFGTADIFFGFEGVLYVFEWDLITNKCHCVYYTAIKEYVSIISISCFNGRYLAIACESGQLYLYDRLTYEWSNVFPSERKLSPMVDLQWCYLPRIEDKVLFYSSFISGYGKEETIGAVCAARDLVMEYASRIFAVLRKNGNVDTFLSVNGSFNLLLINTLSIKPLMSCYVDSNEMDIKRTYIDPLQRSIAVGTSRGNVFARSYPHSISKAFSTPKLFAVHGEAISFIKLITSIDRIVITDESNCISISQLSSRHALTLEDLNFNSKKSVTSTNVSVLNHGSSSGGAASRSATRLIGTLKNLDKNLKVTAIEVLSVSIYSLAMCGLLVVVKVATHHFNSFILARESDRVRLDAMYSK